MAIPFVDLIIEDAPKIPDVLDKGIDTTLHWVADAAEDTLASLIPAYGVARTQAVMLCTTTGKTPDECQGYINTIKYKLFDDFARVTGLRSIVAGIIATWRKIPKVVRDALKNGGAAIAQVSSMMEEGKNLALDVFSYDPAKTLAELEQAPSLLVKSGLDLYGTTFNEVGGLVNMWKSVGMKLADIIKIPVMRQLVTGAIDILSVPIDVIGDVAKAGAWLMNEAEKIGESIVNGIEGIFTSAFESHRSSVTLKDATYAWVYSGETGGQRTYNIMATGTDVATGTKITGYIGSVTVPAPSNIGTYQVS